MFASDPAKAVFSREDLPLDSLRLCRIVLLAVAVVVGMPAYGAATPAKDDDIYVALLGWAVKLSGYPQPALAPKVKFVPQEFFNKNACRRKECHVWGWYPNTGENVVYVHEAVRALIADSSNEASIFAASIIVHEFTHYLQAANRGFAQYRCEEALQLEREAYGVQSAYIVGYGRYFQVGVSMHTTSCEGSASEHIMPDALPASGQDPRE